MFHISLLHQASRRFPHNLYDCSHSTVPCIPGLLVLPWPFVESATTCKLIFPAFPPHITLLILRFLKWFRRVEIFPLKVITWLSPNRLWNNIIPYISLFDILWYHRMHEISIWRMCQLLVAMDIKVTAFTTGKADIIIWLALQLIRI